MVSASAAIGHVRAIFKSQGQAGYANRSLVFITGLAEGRVFPAAIEDPVLLDAERQRISPALRCASDRIEEAVYAALRVSLPPARLLALKSVLAAPAATCVNIARSFLPG